MNRKTIALPVVVDVFGLIVFDYDCVRIVHGEEHVAFFIFLLLLLLKQVQLILSFALLILHQVHLLEVHGMLVEVPMWRIVASSNLMLLHF